MLYPGIDFLLGYLFGTTPTKGFQNPFQCVCGGFPKPINNSQTLSGCVKIQLNSGTIYPERESDFTSKRINPARPRFTSDASQKPRMLPELTDWL